MERIVVVGGGAGGLELATELGKKLGKKKQAEIILIDRNSTHVWKPLLHEVASGALDSRLAELDYRGQGARAAFRFLVGTLTGIDRDNRQVQLAPIVEDGEEVLAERSIRYDRLILAVGSVTADFGVDGVKQHCYFLDSTQQADNFHHELLNEFLRVNQALEDGDEQTLDIAIVGGGATGVELAAELVHSVSLLNIYGLTHLTRERLKVSLVEAGPRLLPALPEGLAHRVKQKLESLGVNVITGNPAVKAGSDGLTLKNDAHIDANLMVWAAGIRAPDFLASLGLAHRKNNQLLVNEYLQSTDDPSVYALGDCAACAIDDDRFVPPRAQSAHQMAACLATNIQRELKGRAAKPFKYKDRGSLVSLSRFSAVGNLMQSKSLSMSIEGTLARYAYASLYRMHQRALHGWWKMLLIITVDKLNHAVKPRLKLH
ncbi:MAG: FAD-dependent oxidoreductase [Idiomarina sp.]|uniref:NAD(P)/FAD-dependent oxidoreductase n=1 Tax=Idiomarina sp. TaxID=1874361 RepID=UPI000C0E299C|nr:NAD(P)/FAD-dependent oxidoreductase [Idiomarina sp.]MBL4741907.1 NAD(P)/FAD-dependent oxidoreductase [Idiomarina sp.]MBT42996.1 FAD-dependent oxidoreductase [Idiomarina sp.]PHQ77472.1 MAG: FAD-dependent oxidoreductase [Idiomarina sp.]